MKLSAAQIAGYASQAGFPAAQIPTAVAVALAESGGNTDDQGDVILQTAKWGPSVGLWQIRSLKGEALSSAAGADRYRDASKLTDPTFNAQAARAIWGEAGGWSPWSTYPGTYLMYLPQARAAAKAPAAIGTGTSSGTATMGSVQTVGFGDTLGGALGLVVPGAPLALDLLTSPRDTLDAAKQGLGLLANVLGFIAKAAAWLADPGNWLRIIKVWVGTWLVVLGLAITAWPALSPVVNAAATVIPAGKVAKVAGAAKSAGGAAKAAKAAAAPAAAPAPAAA